MGTARTCTLRGWYGGVVRWDGTVGGTVQYTAWALRERVHCTLVVRWGGTVGWYGGIRWDGTVGGTVQCTARSVHHTARRENETRCELVQSNGHNDESIMSKLPHATNSAVRPNSAEA